MISEPSSLNPSTESPYMNDSASQPKPQPKQGGGTLRERLLLTVVPTTLIPLIVVSAIGINITRYQQQQNQRIELEQIALIARETSQTFLNNIAPTDNQQPILEAINNTLQTSLRFQITDSQVLQIIDSSTGNVVNGLAGNEEVNLDQVIGGDTISEVGRIFAEGILNNDLETTLSSLQNISGFDNVSLTSPAGEDINILSLEYQDRFFNFTIIPDTNLITVVSMTDFDLGQVGGQLIIIFATIAIFLGFLAVGNIILLAQTLSQPLTNLTDKAQQVAQGDLNAQAILEGTQENRTLADNFNALVTRVKELIKEQEAIALEQRQEKEKLELGIFNLLDELQYAVDGDLTVRASLDSMEMSTVADLCNAILDSLQDIAAQVKESSRQVATSLNENEQSIQELAVQTIRESKQTRKTLESVQKMSYSIEEVATNANQAATLADDAYKVTKEGSSAMDETVESIVSLRSNVGETAKKMKRLGESSQNISQVVSLIEEIALKTNLLAINASVEASRAGEQGQGFTVVAEQVGALAEQSAAATKQIAQLVTEIQRETQDVTIAMESGTSQVVNTTRLVESTKQRLEKVLERSQRINELMQSISQSTVSQAQTSRLVTELMQEIADQSEQRLFSSEQIAQSIKDTATIAKELESAVEQFKVNE
ncbi:methyl-accepting chemotaxis sensory transducer [Cyanobacterium stanieri PCC 7202]|uniref:Methyl-accepting chemotaxis sensory transducer n=1 Tax=Cyanobacterium stanieri (strain ATCC 29140 / PCC 7202) TaxID=292563 RepID=K9YNJ0_CYASC|nr:methyl-accepting chemotaxis sensory transducer [Cyanobacterium stanieri PCC 7202]